MPPVRNRRRQRATFSSVIPNSLAITLFCPPSAARRMIRARSTWRAGSNLARACCSNMERCSVLKVTGGAMRILALHCEGRAREYKRHYLWRTTLDQVEVATDVVFDRVSDLQAIDDVRI